MDARTGWCMGCFRTLDEIAAWSVLDEGGKCAVLARLPERARRAAIVGDPGVPAPSNTRTGE